MSERKEKHEAGLLNEKGKKPFHQHWQKVSFWLALYDVIAVCASYFIGLWLRFDGRYTMIPTEYLVSYAKFVPIYAIICLLVFCLLRLYNTIWRFASYSELIRVVWSTIITTVVHTVGITVFFKRMPISYYIFGAMIQFLLILGIRFSYRFVLLERNKRNSYRNNPDAKRVMIIGAGSAGQTILREIMRAEEIEDRVCCIIDDNPNKWNREIDGIPVVGGRDSILYAVGKYGIEKIYVAIPSSSAQDKRDILNICKETGCELKNLPGVYQFVTGEVSIKAMKPVAIEDLLGRETIKVDMMQIFAELKGKTIMVTGGGGSIGSELCRQIADHGPKQLIIFDVYENNAYDIQQELRKKYPSLDLQVIIGSVRDSRKVNQMFETYKPDIVYHAAAHKHVPLMEDAPCEAIKNNAIGTYKTAYAAMMNGCQKFVLISTDKAVNPTNIMGASKRLCEMILQTFDRKIKEGKVDEIPLLYAHADDEDGAMNAGKRNSYAFARDGVRTSDSIDSSEATEKTNAFYKENSQKVVTKKETTVALDNYGNPIKTDFVAVRFGNVLGSNGSVIPLFKRQIEAGGPLTVTHPDIIRYFMTIPEAVSLVLQAGTYAEGGEIFILDMGEPMKIDTMARNLIKLSGLRPDIDIQIQYTGLRPGEKLYEEKLMAEEGMKTTPNKLIHIGCPIAFDSDKFLVQLKELMKRSYANDENIRELVQEMTGTYHPAEHS